jgi:hypothetical protein
VQESYQKQWGKKKLLFNQIRDIFIVDLTEKTQKIIYTWRTIDDFPISAISSVNTHFRFQSKIQFHRLLSEFDFPEETIVINTYKFKVEEILLISLALKNQEIS